jgi:hemoglobin-like flavoprotein
MSPDQLAELRKFLACVEPRLPQAIAIMYSRLLEAIPEAAELFKGDLPEQQKRYLHVLQEIVRLTRSSHLWPVQALTGTATVPAIDKLGSYHSCLGVTPGQFDKMKTVLVECFREYCPERFSAEAEAALGFVFDVLAKASNNTCGIDPEVFAQKNKLPHRDKPAERGSFAGFSGAEAREETL